MHHIYLSPHLDDAMLATGGLIYAQRSRGEPVTIVTFCAASPPEGALSPLAEACHAAWGGGPDPAAQRRAEDGLAWQEWRIPFYHGATPDSIYRKVGAEWRYPDAASLFGPVAPDEAEHLPAAWRQWLDALGLDLTQSVIYAPLAAANHVDHQLARQVGCQLRREGKRVWFYEDFPHAEKPGALAEARAWFGAAGWRAHTVRIALDAKITGVRRYASQIAFLFGGDAAMVRRMRQFTAETACEIDVRERLRRYLAGAGGRRERVWRTLFGYPAHAERIWSLT